MGWGKCAGGVGGAEGGDHSFLIGIEEKCFYINILEVDIRGLWQAVAFAIHLKLRKF